MNGLGYSNINDLTNCIFDAITIGYDVFEAI